MPYNDHSRAIVFRSGNSSQWLSTIHTVRDQGVSGFSHLNSSDQLDWMQRARFLRASWIPAESKDALRRRDMGHQFHLITNSYLDDSPYVQWDRSSGTIRRSYSGYLNAKAEHVDGTSIWWPTVSEPSLTVQQAAGTTAIARVLPKNSVASAYVGLGEIMRDGVPHLPFVHQLKDRAAHFQDLGKEYLNVEFGWKPFCNDLQNMARAAANSHALLSQYERDSGRNVRRRYTLPFTTSTTTSNTTGVVNPALGDSRYPSVGTFPMEVSKTRSTAMWFSGCFTYHLARSDTALGVMKRGAQEANKLFGILPTPDNVWKAQPWSWAIDWATNTGDVIHNLSALSGDGQVMRWGYLMAHSRAADTYTLSTMSVPEIGRDLFQTFGSEAKSRIHATPYGFGLDQTLFTSQRLAIIAALGISLVPGKVEL